MVPKSVSSALLHGSLIVFGLLIGWVLLETSFGVLSFVEHSKIEVQARSVTQGPPNEIRILCVGESTTHGLGTDAWPAQLERWLKSRFPTVPIKVINFGIPSIVTDQVLARLPGWLETTKPHIVITMLGINDGDNVLVLSPIGSDHSGLSDSVIESSRAIKFLRLLKRSEQMEHADASQETGLLELYNNALELRRGQKWEELAGVLNTISGETSDIEDLYRLAVLENRELRRPNRAIELLEQGLTSKPNHIPTMMLLAEIKAPQDSTKALSLYTKILSLDSSHRPAILGKARLLLGLNRDKEALLFLREVQSRGRDFELSVMEAQILLRFGEKAQAIQLIERLADIADDGASAGVIAYDWLVGLGENARADAILDVLRANIFGNQAIDERVLRRAVKHKDAPEVFAIASLDYSQIAAAASSCPRCSTEALILQVASEKYPDAVPLLEDFRTAHPDLFKDLSRGTADGHGSDTHRRKTLLLESFERGELSPYGKRELKRLLMALYDFPRAHEVIDSLLSSQPTPSDFLDVNNLILARDGKPPTEEIRRQAYEQGARRFPDSCFFLDRWIRALPSIDSTACLTQCKAGFSRCSQWYEMLWSLIIATDSVRGPQEALNVASEAVAANYNSAFPNIYQSLMYERNQDLSQAVAALNAGIEKFQGANAALGRLGNFYLRHGPPRKRREVAQRVIDRYGYSGSPVLELARAMFEEGGDVQALTTLVRWADALDIDGSCPDCAAVPMATSHLVKYVDDARREKFLEAIGGGRFAQQFTYRPKTAENYKKIASLIRGIGARHIAMQYPLVEVGALKNLFDGDSDIHIVSNEKNFTDARRTNTYDQVFIDRIGRVFGHMTDFGNSVVIESLGPVVEGVVTQRLGTG